MDESTAPSWLRSSWISTHLALVPFGTVATTTLLLFITEGHWQWWSDEADLIAAGQISPFAAAIYAATIFLLERLGRMFWMMTQRRKDIEKGRAEGRQERDAELLSEIMASGETVVGNHRLRIDPGMSTPSGWPRNSYTGPGGGLYTGPGGGAYTGPGGGAYTGPGGGLYTGPGGGLYPGPGGGLYTGPGGGLYPGPGGGLYTGPGGGLYPGPGGGLYPGPGGGLFTGPDPNPYYSIIPPRHLYLEYLRTHPGYEQVYQLLKTAWRL